MSFWDYFDRDEFECKCGCGGNQIDLRLVDVLDEIRGKLGFALVVSSGYRCPAHNERVSSTGRNGPHTTGKAADIRVKGVEAFLFLQAAFESGKIYGIGVNQRGDHRRRFIHVDMIDASSSFRPTVWTY